MKNERNEVLEQLYEEHYDSVFRLCASIVRNDRIRECHMGPAQALCGRQGDDAIQAFPWVSQE